MKKITILFCLLIGGLSAGYAQESSISYDTDIEMREQMQLIVNELGLEKEKIYELGQIMAAKQKAKEEKLAQIEALKQEMISSEMNAEKQIQGMLTPEQWEKYKTELKPKLQADLEKRMEKVK